MKATPSRLTVTTLEDRVQPATFGLPWTGASHLTLSFVPDGTIVDNQPSSLFGRLEAGGLSRSAWQGEVLKAFQTWSEAAGVNVGVVADSGDPLGVGGFVEGDTRFGDIRIAARPLSGSVLAVTTPPGVIGDTRTGDVVLNSNMLFNVGGSVDGLGRFTSFDLYSTVLQEAGHALGVGNSPDPGSPMFEQYTGRRTGLTGGDVGQLQSLYGTRPADPLEGKDGNQSSDRATELKLVKPKKGQAQANVSAEGDVTTRTDVDYFKVKVPKDGAPNGLTVRVQSRGASLVAARVTVSDQNGLAVGTGTAVNGVAEVRLTAVDPKSTYYVRVEADATSAFKVGKYKVSLVFDPTAADAAGGAADAVQDDAGTNETAQKATSLDPAAGYADKSRYTATAVLRSAADVDVYLIQAQKVGKDEANVGTVTVTTLEPTGQPPVVEVLDDKQNPVSVQVLANGGGVYTVQFGGARSDGKYYLRVSAGGRGDAAVGLYQLETSFRRQVVNLATYGGGTLTAAAPVQYLQLDIARSQLQNFVLSAASSGAVGRTAVSMTIYDAAGQAVATLFARAGDTVSKTIYLAPGRYTVAFSGGVRNGPAMDALTYSLKGTILSDPIGSGAVDSGGNPVPVPPPTSPPPPPPPAPGQGQPPPDYTWGTLSPAGLTAAQARFGWRNPWGP